ncbi:MULTISPECIES: hypothetical protein [Acinetobacter calcoaceticus/baumannii complex]|nr:MULTISPECIES: hypothetical protein [Acinetobacter calcoaceticus/baumannii complex]CAH1096151.1 phage protein [Acinetobacter phage MD-2021a]AKQ32632.1 DNA primase [Acinetobacter baumannii]ARG33587.1 DNA primase [Acinetobacter baumannii]EKU5515590.1 DNA primase [Acinetobacter baumannii]EKV0974597.1 DNA primase [Acinetobacter baumannii]
MRLNISEYDARQIFANYLRETAELDITADQLKVDGTRHYVKCLKRSQKNKHSKSGWYRLNFAFDVPSVIWGNYNTGNKEVWHLDPKLLKKESNLSLQELRKLEREKKQYEIRMRRNHRFQRTLQRIAKTWSRIEYNRAQPVQSIHEHPYLKNKAAFPEGYNLDLVRIIKKQPLFAKSLHIAISRVVKKAEAKGLNIDYIKPKYFQHAWFQNHHIRPTLINAYYDVDLKIQNCQLISALQDRETGKLKFFKGNLTHGRKDGVFCPIHRLPAQDEKIFALTEGFATGKSFARICKEKPNTIAAFDKESLISVAIAIRNKWPDTTIYIAADNDLNEQLNGKTKTNGGLIKAYEATQAVSGYVLIPPIKKDELTLSDWNDLELKYGTQHCREIIKQQLIDIAEFNQSRNMSNFKMPAMASANIHKPQINIQKTTAALDPAIFTSWLIHLMENQKEKDVDLSMAKDIVQAVSSNEQKQVLPMLKVICQKNGWHDLDQALNLMSDKVEIRNNNEKEALNRVNMTLQAIFYASNNTIIDASKKEKAEEMLKNTIEFIGYLPISRAEKVNIYTNIKDNIFEATDEAEPRWSKTLLKLCKETISEMENKQVNQFENQKSLSYERT